MKSRIRDWIRITGGLRFRLMLPAVVFILIFSVLFIALNNYYTSRLLDTRLEREAVRISGLLYEYRFALNPTYLKRLGKVIEGRIAVFDGSGHIVSASFDEPETPDFLSYADPSEIRNRHAVSRQDTNVIELDRGKGAFILVSRRLGYEGSDPKLFIVILTPLHDLQSTKYQAAVRTLFSGGIALCMAFVAAGLVLKKISLTVHDLLNVTNQIASGDFRSRAGLSDISELNTLAVSINQMSERLSEYEKKLVDSTRLLSANKITAAMAHEIKNPLSSMKMLAQIIQKRFDHDPEGKEMTAAFIKEINRVDTLVSDLRTLSGPVKYTFSMVHPGIPLDEVIMVMTPKLDHLNIRLKSHKAPVLPDIMMDKDKIKQVLWNLMMNAAESMPKGGDLEVCVILEDQTKRIEYLIKDGGPGIDPLHLENIFTPFFTTKKEGIGIGLYISREIAQAHTGDLRIFPTDRGTTAVLSIPVNRA